MAKSTSPTKSATDTRLGTLLTLATKTAKSDLGEGALNKDVEAKAVLATKVTENGKTAKARVNAGVTLGVSTETTDAEPSCGCAGTCGC